MGSLKSKPKPHASASSKDIPAIWPGAFGAYKLSRNVVKRNLSLLFPLWVVYLVIDVLLTIASPSHDSLLGSLINLIIGTVFTVMIAQVLLAGVRGRKTSFKEILGGDLPSLTIKLLVLEILTSVSVLASLLLLIIPAFFVIPRLILAPYFLIDKDMGPLEAFQASWTATKGSTLKVWGIISVALLIALLLVTIVGIPIAVYLLFMYSGAPAVLYAYILRQRKAQMQSLPKQG